MLFHYSEDPNIRRFEPRHSRHAAGITAGKSLVWAIDEYHSPVYFFPRECPRIVLWPVSGSTRNDIDRWIGSDARMVAHIESTWAERFEECQLFRYTFDETGFESLHDHGVHVSPNVVEPVDISPVGSLAAALNEANVELQIVESFEPLAESWQSTLHFSGVRLKNARSQLTLTGSNPR